MEGGGIVNTFEIDTSDSEKKLDNLLKKAIDADVQLDSVDKKSAEALEKMEESIAAIDTQLDSVDKKSIETIGKATRAAQSVIGSFQSLFAAFGSAIGQLQSAILGAVFTGIQAVINIALTYETNPYTAIYGAIIAGIAIATQIATAIAVEQGMGEAANNIRTAQNIMSSFSGLFL